jgi:hypothetical protein
LGGFIAGEEDREVVALSGLEKVHRASKVNKCDVRSILSRYDPVVGLENGKSVRTKGRREIGTTT